jgi:hypothetical protein
MKGYCPTRSGLTPVAAPHSPHVAWSTSLVPQANPENFLPAELVVDRSGRAYVAVDSSPNNPSGPYEIDALDPDGSLAWRVPFAGVVNSLALAADGTLWAISNVGQDAGPYENVEVGAALMGLSRDGSMKAQYLVSVPPDPTPPTFDASLLPGQPFFFSLFTSMAIGSDASFFLFGGGGHARAIADGTTVWGVDVAGIVANPQNDTNPPIMLTPNDDVVAGGVEFDPKGNPIYDDAEAPFPTAYGASILAPNGDLLALQNDGTGNLAVLRLSPSGIVDATFQLGSPTVTFDASQLAIAGDGTVLVLLANEIPTPGNTRVELQVVAINPSFEGLRWTAMSNFSPAYTPSSPQDHYGIFVDPNGTVVVSAGVVEGLDLGTGDTLWQVAPPNPSSCMEPAVLGAGGSILAAQCDGSVFLASDP